VTYDLVLFAINLKNRDGSFAINLISRRMPPYTLGLHVNITEKANSRKYARKNIK